MVLQGCLKGVWSLKEVSSMFQGSFKGLSSVFSGYFKFFFVKGLKEVSREFSEISMVFQACFKGVSIEFYENFRCVSKQIKFVLLFCNLFQRCFMEVSRMLQEFFWVSQKCCKEVTRKCLEVSSFFRECHAVVLY